MSLDFTLVRKEICLLDRHLSTKPITFHLPSSYIIHCNSADLTILVICKQSWGFLPHLLYLVPPVQYEFNMFFKLTLLIKFNFKGNNITVKIDALL